MHRRSITAAAVAVLALTLTACGSSDSGDAKPAPATSSSTAAAATPTTTPPLSADELKAQCSDAVADAAPGWDDWSYNPGKWQDDPRTPEVCQGLADEDNPPRGNRAFMAALVEGLEMADDPRARQ